MMSQTVEDLEKKEYRVREEIEKLEDSQRASKEIEESYEAFFHDTYSFYRGLGKRFLKNDFEWLLKEQEEDLRQEQYPVFDALTEESQDLHRKKRQLEEDEEELFYEKRRILNSEEEDK